ncbi:hypothetical protein HK099_000074 [Clydaea vesicula]|uniref:Uncharacterized protein n=1 Tax=Clydaea vesicula TaxID=447962 RepID=A0AAD5U7R3_9FUNG|nr:hypothetical protein HK099_000074 [Clydaea vesicula]KAJ3389709.1 hypothetical protein HDU92_000907 [Lobulomyces angularis]
MEQQKFKYQIILSPSHSESSLVNIPIRKIKDAEVVFLSDIRKLLPDVTTLMLNDYPVPSLADENGLELIPVRFPANENVIYDSLAPLTRNQLLIRELIKEARNLSLSNPNRNSLFEEFEGEEIIRSISDEPQNSVVNNTPAMEKEGLLSTNPQRSTRITHNHAETTGKENKKKVHRLVQDSVSGSDRLERRNLNDLIPLASSSSEPPAYHAPVVVDSPPVYDVVADLNINIVRESLLVIEQHVKPHCKVRRFNDGRDMWRQRVERAQHVHDFKSVLLLFEMAFERNSLVVDWAKQRQDWVSKVLKCESLIGVGNVLIEFYFKILQESYLPTFLEIKQGWESRLRRMAECEGTSSD